MKGESGERRGTAASDYDRKAASYDWLAPELVFGLAYAYVEAGESLLDIGIGTGLGSVLFYKAGLRVSGMDVSPDMLAECRRKGFAEELVLHDLRVEPWPFGEASIDHAVSIGVLGHFADPGPVFREAGRILRGGVFAFVTGDRAQGESASFVVGPEHTGTGKPATLYRYGDDEIAALLEENDFETLHRFAFDAWMDPGKTRSMRMTCHVARRKPRG